MPSQAPRAVALRAAKRATEKARKKALHRATPRWLTKTDRQEISAIYQQAQSTGLFVDHIVPLRGVMVCGLHVPWNLAPIGRAANSRKGNRLE